MSKRQSLAAATKKRTTHSEATQAAQEEVQAESTKRITVPIPESIHQALRLVLVSRDKSFNEEIHRLLLFFISLPEETWEELFSQYAGDPKIDHLAYLMPKEAFARLKRYYDEDDA